MGFVLGCIFESEPETFAEHVKERRQASIKVKGSQKQSEEQQRKANEINEQHNAFGH